MTGINRRGFFTSSLGGLAASLAAGPPLNAQDPPEAAPKARPEPFAPDTLFLTWQRDPTTTMTVQWIGSDWETPNKDISFAAGAGGWLSPKPDRWTVAKTRSKPFPMTDLKVYRAELTGLTPGTDYRFKIGAASPEYRFRTMPAKATDAFHFVSGGDCGINPHAVANNALAAKQDPYFAVIGGDLGYDNGRSPRTALTFIRNYSKAMVDSKGRLIPLVVCIGNHEVNGGYAKPRTAAPFYFALFDGLYSDTSYASLDFGQYLSLVLLDSGHTAPIGGDQADWLDTALKARVDHPHLIAVNHVPAYPSYRAPEGTFVRFGTGEQQRKCWVPLFERYNVDVVLEHHDHTFKRTHPLLGGLRHDSGVLYLGDGSWGMLRVPKAPEQRPYLAAVGGSYHFTVHRLEGDQRFHVALEEGGKVIDICSTRKKARKG
jgi:hypothetical protein